MARRLKVFVVPAGFSDAYVAAPSRKAALAAWGSEHDLFARGVAQEVTDAALMAEPLAKPGEVIKRSRGTTAEQIAALPAQPARPAKAPEDAPAARAKVGRGGAKHAASTPRKAEAKPEPPPKPSSDALAAAEQALADLEDRYRYADAKLTARQRALDRERRDLDAKHDRESKALSKALAAERDRYDTAMARWREGRGAG
ncbi:hypothetical protein [Sphingomonas glacialis]|uniref:Cell envelope biogenesis protein TolA n=1 Tax=Sphingomonas glacialis TaxID=658225 RepID=A0A502FHT0_9SPHN|nr:hypothetical protein [Sphingomonas glacialis]TPG48998.1 hypothetical protein EAH76_19400 [Sphingomonas glacialis]